MVVMEKRPEQTIRSGCKAELVVEREDISFHDLPGDRVQVQVRVQNVGEQCSAPTVLRLESAPLGAFVPWQPLTRLPVPALEPGESRLLSAEVRRARPSPLGDFNGVPPRRLLAAVNSPDRPSPQKQNSGMAAMLALLGLERKGRSPATNPSEKPTLAADLWDLLGRGQPHWAGNINVFVGARPVERHLARALRIYPGRTNLAMFVVGEGLRNDAFSFELAGLMPDWEAALYDTTNQRSLLVVPSHAPIEEAQWVECSGRLRVVLATHPPAGCEAGKVEVRVTRRSSGKTAIVEFDLDPSAQGTGCYVV